MPFLIAAIVGGALTVGGAATGAMGQRQRRSALNRAKAGAIADFRDLGNEYRDLFGPVMQQYSKEREANIGLYRAEMARAEQSFSRYFDQARAEYGAGMDRALGEMRTGREATIALSRQQTEKQQQAATSRNAFTGIGQTSFGAGQIESIGRQGVLQEGAIREQYASQLSALESQRAQGMSTLSSQMGQGMSAIQQSLASNLSNMYQTYSANIANMSQQGLNSQFAMNQQGLNIGYQYAGQAANLAGAGASAFGSAMGSIGGSLFGAGLGGMMSPAAGAATAGAGGGGGAWGVNTAQPPMANWYTQGYGGNPTSGYPRLGP